MYVCMYAGMYVCMREGAGAWMLWMRCTYVCMDVHTVCTVCMLCPYVCYAMYVCMAAFSNPSVTARYARGKPHTRLN